MRLYIFHGKYENNFLKEVIERYHIMPSHNKDTLVVCPEYFLKMDDDATYHDFRKYITPDEKRSIIGEILETLTVYRNIIFIAGMAYLTDNTPPKAERLKRLHPDDIFFVNQISRAGKLGKNKAYCFYYDESLANVQHFSFAKQIPLMEKVHFGVPRHIKGFVPRKNYHINSVFIPGTPIRAFSEIAGVSVCASVCNDAVESAMQIQHIGKPDIYIILSDSLERRIAVQVAQQVNAQLTVHCSTDPDVSFVYYNYEFYPACSNPDIIELPYNPWR